MSEALGFEIRKANKKDPSLPVQVHEALQKFLQEKVSWRESSKKSFIWWGKVKFTHNGVTIWSESHSQLTITFEDKMWLAGKVREEEDKGHIVLLVG